VRQGTTLRGRVQDATGAPVEGATIRGFWQADGRFRSRQVRSGADGRFRMAGLGDGNLQTMLVTAKGFAQKMENGVATDQEAEATLERAGSIVGRVSQETRDPVPAKVEASPEAKVDPTGHALQVGFREDEYADRSGNFKLEGLEPGKYTLIATLPARRRRAWRGSRAVGGRGRRRHRAPQGGPPARARADARTTAHPAPPTVDEPQG
jgi:hypothetical protein